MDRLRHWKQKHFRRLERMVCWSPAGKRPPDGEATAMGGERAQRATGPVSLGGDDADGLYLGAIRDAA